MLIRNACLDEEMSPVELLRPSALLTHPLGLTPRWHVSMPIGEDPDRKSDLVLHGRLIPQTHVSLLAWPISGRVATTFLLWTAQVACSPDASQNQSANAEVYAEAYCEELCEKYDECAPVPESFGECAVPECTDDALAGLDDDPCLPLNFEVVRCRVERETCGEFFDQHLEEAPGTPCHEQVVELKTCFLQQEADG